jgi:hypothetical protein
MSAQLQDKLEFAMVLGDEARRAYTWGHASTFRIAELAMRLMRAARRMHRINEHQCNGGTERQMQACDEASARIQGRVARLLEPYGITAVWQGDPRGAALRLVLPRTKRTNGSEGYCVPQ